MTIVPRKIVERVMFYQNHLTPWTDNAAAIGLTTQQAGDFALLVIAANNAMNAAEAARDARFVKSVGESCENPCACKSLLITVGRF